jgi:hypothetical protein
MTAIPPLPELSPFAERRDHFLLADNAGVGECRIVALAVCAEWLLCLLRCHGRRRNRATVNASIFITGSIRLLAAQSSAPTRARGLGLLHRANFRNSSSLPPTLQVIPSRPTQDRHSRSPAGVSTHVTQLALPLESRKLLQNDSRRRRTTKDFSSVARRRILGVSQPLWVHRIVHTDKTAFR